MCLSQQTFTAVGVQMTLPVLVYIASLQHFPRSTLGGWDEEEAPGSHSLCHWPAEVPLPERAVHLLKIQTSFSKMVQPCRVALPTNQLRGQDVVKTWQLSWLLSMVRKNSCCESEIRAQNLKGEVTCDACILKLPTPYV